MNIALKVAKVLKLRKNRVCLFDCMKYFCGFPANGWGIFANEIQNKKDNNNQKNCNLLRG